MKRTRKIRIFLGLLPLLIPAVWAEEPAPAADLSDMAAEQFRASGAAELLDTLPSETKSYLIEFGLNPENPLNNAAPDPKTVIDTLANMAAEKIRRPFRTAALILASVLAAALARSLSGTAGESETVDVFQTVTAAAVGVTVLIPLTETVQTAQKAIGAAAVFTAGFVPVFAGILIAAGKVSTAAGFSALLLGVAEAVSQTSAGILTPLAGMFFALNLASEFGPGISAAGFSAQLRKAGLFLLSFLMTVFLGILNIQTAVAASADTLAAKTAKFFVGSFVPVVGGALGDAVGAVGAGLSAVRSAFGAYAVAAVFLLLLPVILELSIWRIALGLARGAAEMFGLKRTSSVLAGAGDALAFLFGLLILCAALFVISFAVVIAAGNKGV